MIRCYRGKSTYKILEKTACNWYSNPERRTDYPNTDEKKEAAMKAWLNAKLFDNERCPGHASQPGETDYNEQDGTKKFMTQVSDVLNGSQETWLNPKSKTIKVKKFKGKRK